MAGKWGLARKTVAFAGIVLLVILLFIDFIDIAYASSPAMVFEKTYSGPDNQTIMGNRVQETSDNGYLIVGTLIKYPFGNSTPDQDIYVIKTDVNGVELWNRTIGGIQEEFGWNVLATDNGGGIIIGRTASYGNGQADNYIISIDGDGNILWTKTIGDERWERASIIIPSGDGGYVLAGTIEHSTTPGYADAYMFKVDRDFNVIWQRQYGDQPIYKDIYDIQSTSDGGYLLTGYSYNDINPDVSDIFIVKTDPVGNAEFIKVIDYSKLDTGLYGQDIGDGTYLITATSRNETSSSSCIIRLNSNGDIIFNIWPDQYWNTGTSSLNIHRNDDGSFAICGFMPKSNVFTDGYQAKIVNIDKNGNILNNNTFGNFSMAFIQYANVTKNGNYIMVGSAYGSNSSGKVYLSKFVINPKVITIEDVAPPVAAVVTGASIVIFGMVFERLFDFIRGGLKSYAQRYYSVLEARYRRVTAKPKKPLFVGISMKEIGIGLLAAILLGIAFIIVNKVSFDPVNVALFVLIAGVTTVVHELAHLHFAYRYKTDTEFKFWGLGTITMFITTIFFGTVFSQPARTIINKVDQIGKDKVGIVSLAGPVASLLLSILFASMLLFGGGLAGLGAKGLPISLLSCVYSLMPFSPMEGRRVYDWNKWIWSLTFIPMLVVFLSISIFVL